MLDGLKEAGLPSSVWFQEIPAEILVRVCLDFFIFSQNPCRTSTTPSFTFASSQVWILHVKTKKRLKIQQVSFFAIIPANGK